jgi:tRNA dimethylallyltransferase
MSMKIVAIAGTNASGKSSLGVALAKAFNGEVISADSRQVYKGLNLGTGKLTPDEMMGVPHHLIDIAEVSQVFTLADYQRLTYEAADAIASRGRVPFVVGGTGLYIKAVVDGYSLAGAPPDYAMRSHLESLSDQDLWTRLSSLRKDVAAKIDSKNRRRIVRAIEIISQGADYDRAVLNNPRYEALQLGLTWEPVTMKERIMTRLQARMRDGMIDEVRELIEAGVTLQRLDDLGLEYRYIAQFLEGKFADEATFTDALATAIYQFSRRQVRWFRREKSIQWLDSTKDYTLEARERVDQFLTERSAS